MFARIIYFKIKPGTIDEMRKQTEQVGVPFLQTRKGFRGLDLVQISDSEVMAYETWQSKEDADAAQFETQLKIQKALGNILAAPPTFSGGETILHASGPEPHEPGIRVLR